jgi:arginyl-tRNA synthetase
MNIFQEFRHKILEAIARLQASGQLPETIDPQRIATEPPREASHGDIATNAALILGPQVHQNPRAVAELLVATLIDDAAIERVDVAGPGFINLRLSATFWQQYLKRHLATVREWPNLGQGRLVNVEYVSANPTGPMHAGHARGAVFGDALAMLLSKVGYRVTKEFYINDSGGQIDTLARSTHLRYREILGDTIGDIPAGLYPGEYLIDVAQALVARDGRRWYEAPEAQWLPELRQFAVEQIMRVIKDDLYAMNIHHDYFASEAALVAAGQVEAVVAELDRHGLIYRGMLEAPKGKVVDDWEPREQLLFRATQFGDDIDRPLQRSDGQWTYFAKDIAYHYDKFRRGFSEMINVLGADHGGYVKRLQSAVRAISQNNAEVDIKICQLVSFVEDGQPLRMSKRAGTFVTLRDVVDRVGADVMRFIMLTRKNDVALDFDFTKVQEQSKDNPVFYVQYAHARAHSVRRQCHTVFPDMGLDPSILAQSDLTSLTHIAEIGVIKKLAEWPRQIEIAAHTHEPHRIAFYLMDLAAAFHGLWNQGKELTQLRFIDHGKAMHTQARLALVSAIAETIREGLGVLGVVAKDSM